MKISRPLMMCCLAAWALVVVVVPREPDPGQIRLGQKVHVDDGTCPAGQIKEVLGAKLTAEGVQRTRKCVSRK